MKNKLLSLKVHESLGVIMSDLLHKARGALEDLQKEKGGEELHDFRVSVRRLAVWLEVCQYREILELPKGTQKQIKRLVKLTNSARDLEVRLAMFNQHLQGAQADGGAPRISKLKHKWEDDIARGYHELLKDVPKIFAKVDPAVKETIGDLEKSNEAKITTLRLRNWIDPVLFEQATKLDIAIKQIGSVADEKEAHRARLLGKALRYLIEPFAAELGGGGTFLKELRRFQDLCGGLRDGLMLAQKLDKAMEKSSQKKEQGVFESANRSNQKEIDYLFKELQSNFLTASAMSFALRVKALDLSCDLSCDVLKSPTK